jgi:hypothetical protein
MKILGWIIMIPVVLFVLLIVARVAFCGPNSSDVKVMKPMAEKISDYIVKNGIPESLKDIPDLPYELKGCEKTEYYQNYKSYDYVSKENAELHKVKEKCNLKNIKIEFGFTEELNNLYIGGSIRMTSINETVLNVYFNTKDNKNFTFAKIDIGSSKSSGICNPMKQ